MPSVINTNLMSLTAQRGLSSSQGALSTAMQRLSSGLRVNSAKDDAAGIVIAEQQTSQIRGNSMAIRNANDAISMAQTAEGAIGQVTEAMQRMRELAVQAANGTYTDGDRANLDKEFQQLGQEVGRILSSTKFNGLAVLGQDAGTTVFQVTADTDPAGQIAVATTALTADAAITAVIGASFTGPTPAIPAAALFGSTTGPTPTSLGSQPALDAIDALDFALNVVSSERATYGAIQNRFQTAINNLQVSVENQTAARSRIMDADFAAETAAMTRGQILQQAGTAMLAQANQAPQNVLSLLR